ncbi:YjfB family protein [Butyrivibrio sp. FCS014]|uniref:YjfB family protein n=1 Tax=Butyrivibrio sp. FCS014 TaxID=1408304 RepID=UPI000464E666|nr:YjfB family protein [Butyrivibrio sp. FCS014]
MDIPALSMALSQNKILNDFGVAMLSKSLDNLQDMGEAMVETMDASMELSVNPNLGANFDIRI